MAVAFMKNDQLMELDNEILCVVEGIRGKKNRADLNSIYNEIIKTEDFENVQKDYLNDRICVLLQTNKLKNKINRDKDSYHINKNTADESVIHFIPPSQFSTNNIDTPSFNSSFSSSNNTTNYGVNNVIASEMFIDNMFEEMKMKKLKDEIMTSFRKDTQDTIKEEFKLHLEQFRSESINSKIVYLKEIEILKEELVKKDSLIKDLLDTIQQIHGINNIQQKSIIQIPSFILESDTSDNEESFSSNEGDLKIGNENENENFLKEKLTKQLEKIKLEKKEEYYKFKKIDPTIPSSTVPLNNQKENNEKYPENTIVIAGDSIINGIMEERLNRKDVTVKVLKFPGADVDELRHRLIPILKKRPAHLFLHGGTNDAVSSTSREILDKLLSLKSMIINKLPNCKVYISTPTFRSDIGKATLTVKQLTNHLTNLEIDLVDNRNITDRGIGRKGLHLNSMGTKQLAKNFLNVIRNI